MQKVLGSDSFENLEAPPPHPLFSSATSINTWQLCLLAYTILLVRSYGPGAYVHNHLEGIIDLPETEVGINYLVETQKPCFVSHRAGDNVSLKIASDR